MNAEGNLLAGKKIDRRKREVKRVEGARKIGLPIPPTAVEKVLFVNPQQTSFRVRFCVGY